MTTLTRGQWLEKFETEVLKLWPRLVGRFNVHAGDFYYLRDYSPRRAAEEWINERNEIKQGPVC